MMSFRDLEFAQQRHRQLREDASRQQSCEQEHATPSQPALREKMGDLLIAAGEKLKAKAQVENASIAAG